MKLACWLFGHKKGYPDIRKDWDITLSERCVRCHAAMPPKGFITLEYLLEHYSPEQIDSVFPKDLPKIGGTVFVQRPR